MSRGFFVTAVPASGTAAAYKLPFSSELLTIGWERNYNVTQAPESEVAIVYGDGTRTIKPVKMKVTVQADNERAAADLLATILANCASSTCILRYDGTGLETTATNVRRLDYSKFKSFQGEPQIGVNHIIPITLEFLPTRPYWTDQNGSGDYPF
jgi:hypothetical protein